MYNRIADFKNTWKSTILTNSALLRTLQHSSCTSLQYLHFFDVLIKMIDVVANSAQSMPIHYVSNSSWGEFWYIVQGIKAVTFPALAVPSELKRVPIPFNISWKWNGTARNGVNNCTKRSQLEQDATKVQENWKEHNIHRSDGFGHGWSWLAILAWSIIDREIFSQSSSDRKTW